MNEPMMILSLDRSGKEVRRLAPADARADSPRRPDQAPATIRTRWPAAIAP